MGLGRERKMIEWQVPETQLLQDKVLRLWGAIGTTVCGGHTGTMQELTKEKKKMGFIAAEKIAHSCRPETTQWCGHSVARLAVWPPWRGDRESTELLIVTWDTAWTGRLGS